MTTMRIKSIQTNFFSLIKLTLMLHPRKKKLTKHDVSNNIVLHVSDYQSLTFVSYVIVTHSSKTRVVGIIKKVLLHKT